MRCLSQERVLNYWLTKTDQRLIVEIETPQEVRIINGEDRNWLPIKVEQINNGFRRLYEIKYDDLEMLQVQDEDASVLDNVEIMTRVKSLKLIMQIEVQMLILRVLRIPYDRNAKLSLLKKQ